MSDSEDRSFFELRKEGKTYVSKVFTYNARDADEKRTVKMVFEGSDELLLGEIDGVMCLRLTGQVRKTQISAIISQDDKSIKRLTLQTFKNRTGDWIEASDKHEFTFRSDEFERLLNFLDQLQFVDLSNRDRFQIQDISTGGGRKVIIDAGDRAALQQFQGLTKDQRANLLQAFQGDLTPEEINIILGRRRGIDEFEHQMAEENWSEKEWQDFFEREDWVFGYGLDYRIMRQFAREATVGSGGSDNRNRPIVDFLMTFTDYTVLVEIKTPRTAIFTRSSGRAGTWKFSSAFVDAVSQILEQKAEWSTFAQTGEHLSPIGDEVLAARTRNAKSILVIGAQREFSRSGNLREEQVMKDTFELFRRETHSIEIVTFDELLERARFITRNK
ncbi:MAG: hypothetical protein CL808_00155 [Citromicrobium sp.]|nr:hypothetical protein [Citromicrobium sp.]